MPDKEHHGATEPRSPESFTALSLWQPWASAIAEGLKRIETRHWSTSYRGILLIHAAKHGSGSRKGVSEELLDNCRMAALRPMFPQGASAHTAAQLPFGAIVAVVRLATVLPGAAFDVGQYYRTWEVGEHPNDALPSRTLFTAEEHSLGCYGPGRYGWVLTELRKLPEPIPYRGAQGLFKVPREALSAAALAVIEGAK